jgi:hypothetical protein
VLNRKLRRRADLDEVKQSGILPIDPPPVRVMATRQLLEEHIHHRPTTDDMERKHVWTAPESALLICPSVKNKIATYERRLSQCV